METFEAILNRRSIRKMKSDPIDDKTVEKILEAARWAPSWANTQCWRLVVVRDKDIKKQLSDTMFSFRRPDGTQAPNRTAQAVNDAPVLIVVCAELGRSGCRPGGEPSTDKGGNWYMFDTALAMQNLILEAHALGIGTVIIGAFDAVKAAEILEVPEGYCAVAMTPLGYSDQEPREVPRKEIPEIMFNDKFGA
ncbi:nitroreductase family protein [Chloroflexota bacterium]